MQLSNRVCTLFLLLLCLFSPGTRAAHGQSAAGTVVPGSVPVAPAGYDVVSVKPNDSGSGSSGIRSRNTTFQATNVSLRMMLVNAYGVQDSLISGLPKWAESARYDINAKIVEPPPDLSVTLTDEQSNELYRAKVRSILTDRFHLKAHKETRILPIYDLVLLPGPPRFKKSDVSEEGHSGTNVHNRNMTATAIPMKAFAGFLSNQLGRTVFDKTGLEGVYNFSLQWSPDELAEAAKVTGAADRPPEIYTALQEQLGLKLVAGKGPSEVLIVDSIEPPVVD